MYCCGLRYANESLTSVHLEDAWYENAIFFVVAEECFVLCEMDELLFMTRKLNESNVGWQSSTQAPILEVGSINILCSKPKKNASLG